MTKIDYKKALKHLYQPSKKDVAFVDVPAMNFFMIDGVGDPNTSPAYHAAIEALFSLSYTMKFMLKKTAEIDYGVMPLEGLWWCENMADFDIVRKENWQWTAMIMQPEHVTPELVQQAIAEVNKNKTLAALPLVRFKRYAEGSAAQIMYIGAFADESPTIKRIHASIKEHGYEVSGKHHEIYLSDFRKTAPEKLKTIIRQPYKAC